MTRELIRERFLKTIEMLKSLKDSEFYYAEYIKSCVIIDDNVCGTVCCVMGWYPKYVPESGLVWRKPSSFGSRPYLWTEDDSMGDDEAIENWHGIVWSVRQALFYGYGLTSVDGCTKLLHQVKSMDDTTLPEVIERFEKIVQVLDSGENDGLFNLS